MRGRRKPKRRWEVEVGGGAKGDIAVVFKTHNIGF